MTYITLSVLTSRPPDRKQRHGHQMAAGCPHTFGHGAVTCGVHVVWMFVCSELCDAFRNF